MKVIQEQIIEFEGKKYHLVDVTGLERPQHQPGCWHCDGNKEAPKDDPDRFKLFDEYCFGHKYPLACTPMTSDSNRMMVYKEINQEFIF